MPIDPNIALQYKPVQLSDPLAQYAQVSQIQSAQQTNQLNNLKMQEYQRGLQEENQLRQLIKSGIDLSSPEAVNQMYAISPTKGLEFQKQQAGLRKTSSETSKLETELVDQKLKQSRQFLDTIDPADPTAPAKYIAWHEANHRDPVIGKALAARGVTAEQSRATIDAAIARGPEAFANLLNQSKLGTEKFIELNRPQYTQQTLGGTVRQLGTPGLGGTATVVPGSEGTVTVTPSALLAAQTAREGHGVTLRGQNLVDAREQQKIALKAEDNRRAADPAFQQSMAQARVTGEAMAKDKVLRATQLPKVLDTAKMTIDEIDALIGKRDAKGNLVEGAAPHPGFSTTVGATLLPGARFVPGTAAADFQSRFDQVKGGAFLQAFETLKGGGSITNIEGEKGTAALNRMSLAQSEKEFVTAAREFQGIVRAGVERAKKLAGGSTTPAAAPTASGSAADPLGIR